MHPLADLQLVYPPITDLALIGDQRTAAIITKAGTVVWYCPGKFDNPSLFASLLDSSAGGFWAVELPEKQVVHRQYLNQSGILQTTLRSASGQIQLTDWMPMGADSLPGICRRFTKAPDDMELVVRPAPDYGRSTVSLTQQDGAVVINNQWAYYASHPTRIDNGSLRTPIPKGDTSWAFLTTADTERPTPAQMQEWLLQTTKAWDNIAVHTTYEGPYQREVADSVRAIRLLTYAPTGGIIAAPTTSLPEVIGGERNYDYRYVWLRDSAMIISALTRCNSDGVEERRFLSFICDTAYNIPDFLKTPLFSIHQEAVKGEAFLSLNGYQNSRPVRIGNNANVQLQLDSLGNVLLAAKLIYNRYDTREHWPIVEQIADFLVDNWQQPDHGLWEERGKKEYTSSKVIVAQSLHFLAKLQPDTQKKKHWQQTVETIREFVRQHCLTRDGAYAVYAGSNDVDVSAALFPVWAYTEPDTDEMKATMARLERDYCRENLYWRHLEYPSDRPEGAFLAGTFWVAQYWIMRKEYAKTTRIIDAALAYMNDVGLFAEEADPDSRCMLGNFPQSFVHAALIGAAIDLNNAQGGH
ncbi:glycoside hydrolase family 15 protein [Nibrella viscosa]|uniref:Glycoside hydrolase family 15 protein n=1 Tax=Nibrella viscosa TaxID=1084524 RepID=A0ABP8K716_9BACT